MKNNSKIFEQLTKYSNYFDKLINDDYYNSTYDIVLKEGKFFESQSLTSDESKIVKKALRTSKETKSGQCFYNAQCLCLHDESNQIEYWEGFVYYYKYPTVILHGFNVINGKLIDITITSEKKQIFGEFEDNIEYMGVKFDKKLIIERILSGKNSTSFIDNWMEGYPILRNKWVNTAA